MKFNSTNQRLADQGNNCIGDANLPPQAESDVLSLSNYSELDSKLIPLNLPTFSEGSLRYCCRNCRDCLNVGCKNMMFICACSYFFIWTSLPRVMTVIDFFIIAILYCIHAGWDWATVKNEFFHFNFEYHRLDIIVLVLFRSFFLFFVFAYQNHRDWYDFNLLYGVAIAITSTVYGVFKLILESGEDMKNFGTGETTVVIFFMVGIWVEVLIFAFVRRKKIRIPNLRVAKTTMQRKAQFAYDKILKQLAFHKPRQLSLSDVDVASAVQRDCLIENIWHESEEKKVFELERSLSSNNPLMKDEKSSLISSPSIASSLSARSYSYSDFSRYQLPLYPTSSFLKVRDIKVHFRCEEGELAPKLAPVLLCLHGFAGGVFSFTKCWEKLRSVCSCVIAFDRPGFGLTSRKVRPWDENPYSIDFAVYICFQLLRNLEVSSVVLVAHGSGCLVASYFCQKYPELVKSLVLLAPVFHTPKLIQSLFKTRLGKTVITQLVKSEMSNLMLRRMWVHSDNIPPFLEKWYQRILQLDNFDNAMWEMLQIEKPSTEDVRRDFAKLTVPILLIHGKADKIVDISESKDLVSEFRTNQNSGRIKFVSLLNVGHAFHEEFVQKFILELSIFLSNS